MKTQTTGASSGASVVRTVQREDPYGSPCWPDGGDALTNFTPDQRPIYEEAIARYGDGSLYIGKPTREGLPNWFALRQRGRRSDNCQDLSAFWRVFEAVKAEHEAAAKEST